MGATRRGVSGGCCRVCARGGERRLAAGQGQRSWWPGGRQRVLRAKPGSSGQRCGAAPRHMPRAARSSPCRRRDATPVGVVAEDGRLGQAGAHNALGHLAGGRRQWNGRLSAQGRGAGREGEGGGWEDAAGCCRPVIRWGCPQQGARGKASFPSRCSRPAGAYLVGRRVVGGAQHLALNQHGGALAVPRNRLGQALQGWWWWCRQGHPAWGTHGRQQGTPCSDVLTAKLPATRRAFSVCTDPSATSTPAQRPMLRQAHLQQRGHSCLQLLRLWGRRVANHCARAGAGVAGSAEAFAGSYRRDVRRELQTGREGSWHQPWRAAALRHRQVAASHHERA